MSTMLVMVGCGQLCALFAHCVRVGRVQLVQEMHEFSVALGQREGSQKGQSPLWAGFSSKDRARPFPENPVSMGRSISPPISSCNGMQEGILFPAVRSTGLG